MSDSNDRIEAALARLGAEHQPPPGWEDRVLAAVGAPRKRPAWWWFAGPAMTLAAAAVIALAVFPRGGPRELALAVDVTGEQTRGAGASERAIGDIAHVRVTGGAGHRAIWVYRDQRTLVTRCPGDPACRSTSDSLGIDVALSLVGEYTIVALSSPRALPAPTDDYDHDIAAARMSDTSEKSRTLTVR